MAIQLDFDVAKQHLADALGVAESAFESASPPDVPSRFSEPCGAVFNSTSGSYREVLAGLCLTKLQSPDVNLTKPYVAQGADAFNARALDTEVVNPFLHKNRFPAGKSPYLAVFRRQFRFLPESREQLRDKEGYDALLRCLSYLQTVNDVTALAGALALVFYKFIQLRESSSIEIARLRRLSVLQYERLVAILLSTRSGGRLPVFLVRATLEALNRYFSLNWTVEVQGINVADSASHSAGDVTVTRHGEIIFAAEVTERAVDRNRVVTTFNTKIAPYAVEDYLFFVTRKVQPPEALAQSESYFAQGHEVNFVEIGEWIVQTLTTLTSRGRQHFNDVLFQYLSDSATPQQLKAAWNKAVDEITTAAAGD